LHNGFYYLFRIGYSYYRMRGSSEVELCFFSSFSKEEEGGNTSLLMFLS